MNPANTYMMSPDLEAHLKVNLARIRAGKPSAILLAGVPGAGKTSFGEEVARRLDAPLFFYSCAADGGRNLLWAISVQGVVERTHAWVKGPAWRAFEASQVGPAVLVIDEVDKADLEQLVPILLPLLQQWSFEGPEGEMVAADPSRLVVILTTNGRKKLPPEVLRRCYRIGVEFPTGDRLRRIIDSIAGRDLPGSLVELVIRLGDVVRAKDAEMAPSPAEMARCCLDLLEVKAASADIVREVAAASLVKEGGAAALSKLLTFNWAKALQAEARKG